jgi:hypothetical protein
MPKPSLNFNLDVIATKAAGNVDAICADVNFRSLIIFCCRRRSGTAEVLFVSVPLVDGKMATES